MTVRIRVFAMLVLAVITLSRRKLQEAGGRWLKQPRHDFGIHLTPSHQPHHAHGVQRCSNFRVSSSSTA